MAEIPHILTLDVRKLTDGLGRPSPFWCTSAGSLSAAARLLHVEHATVARRVAALECLLGVALVDRRGRRWTLTAAGERIAAIAEKMESDVRAVRRAADGARSELEGQVTISARPRWQSTS